MLPMSFRFYDPIMSMIQEMINEDRREHFFSKTVQNYQNFRQNDLKTVLYDRFFGGGEKSKLTFKY